MSEAKPTSFAPMIVGVVIMSSWPCSLGKTRAQIQRTSGPSLSARPEFEGAVKEWTRFGRSCHWRRAGEPVPEDALFAYQLRARSAIDRVTRSARAAS